MKIVIINQHVKDVIGGSEIQCDLIARELTKFGHSVVYVAVSGSADYDALPYHVVTVRREAKQIADAAIDSGPDIVYWRFNKQHLKDALLRIRNSSIPFVFAGSHINDFRRLPSGAFRQVTRIQAILGTLKRVGKAMYNHGALRHVDGITSLNPDYLHLVNHPRAVTIHNSMVYEDVRPFSWNRPFVVWVANIKRIKRPEVCLPLAEKLAGVSVDLVMVGSIQSREYEYFSDPEMLPKNLFYLGRKEPEEVNGIIREAITLVHTCRPEGFGNNFIQAWLQGRPTVSLEFDPGGYITSRKLGAVSGNDIDRFTEDVLRIVENPKAAAEIGDRAMRFALENFQLEKNVRCLESFLKEVVSNYGS